MSIYKDFLSSFSSDWWSYMGATMRAGGANRGIANLHPNAVPRLMQRWWPEQAEDNYLFTNRQTFLEAILCIERNTMNTDYGDPAYIGECLS